MNFMSKVYFQASYMLKWKLHLVFVVNNKKCLIFFQFN